MKGKIKAISKDKKFILWLAEGESPEAKGRWFSILPACLPYTKKGEAEIDMDEKNIVNKVFMISSSPDTSSFKSGDTFFREESYGNIQEKIGAQWALNAAIELIKLNKPELKGEVTVEHVKALAAELMKKRDELI